MSNVPEFLGGFVRWILKGAKTNLKEEIDGSIDSSRKIDYGFENYLIGIATLLFLLLITILIMRIT
jgi:hypothetical protein